MRWVTAPLEEGGQTRATWGSASQAQDQEGALEVNHIQQNIIWGGGGN